MSSSTPKKPIKTFGKRPVALPCAPSPKPISRSSSIDSILADENDALQAKIDQLLTEPTQMVKKKAKKSDFMDELDLLTSDEEDPLMPDPASKTVKSVHELVEAGENSRFFDEIEYLVEGLRVGTDRGRQLALDELLEKVFGTAGFGGRMRAHGMLALSITNCQDLIQRNERIREGLAILILYLCHDIRKLDAFISHENLCLLASTLVKNSVGISAVGMKYLKQVMVFKDLDITGLESSSLGLWLLAKLSQSLSQSTFKSERESIHLILNKHLSYSDVCLDLTLFDEMQGIRLRWSLLARDLINRDFSLETCLADLQAVSAILLEKAHGRVQGRLALKDLAQRLVTASGPDDHSHMMATDESFYGLLVTVLRTCPYSEPSFSPILIYLLSTLINLIDRSEVLCEKMRFLDGFITFLSLQFAMVCEAARLHLGLVLALLIQDNRSNQHVVQEHVSASDLLKCVQKLLSQYQSSGCLTPALDSTLSNLIGRLEAITFHK